MEHRDISWKRRAITTPFWFTCAIGLTTLMPLWLPVTFVLDLFGRRSFSTTRTFFYFTFFFVVESAGLVWGLALWLLRPVMYRDEARYRHANRILQRWWSSNLFHGAVKIFGVNVTIDGLEEFEDPKPALVMCRHASTLDTMIPLAIVRQMKNMRYVIKSELLASPALDYIAQRIPNVFVVRGSDNPEGEIARVIALGQNLLPNGCVVIYPEGTRFSEKKRARLIEKFSASNNRLLPLTVALERTLPPLREGAVRLVETMRDEDVVFIAHRGIDPTGGMNDLIKGSLTHVDLEIAIWRVPADEVPRERAKAERFILENWLKIDAWARGKSLDEALPVAELPQLAPEVVEPEAPLRTPERAARPSEATA